MTAAEWHKRRRRATGAVLAGLSAGAAVCGLVRTGTAQAEPIPAAGPRTDAPLAPAAGAELVIPALPVLPAVQPVPIELLPPPAKVEPAKPATVEPPKLEPLTIELPKADAVKPPLPVPTIEPPKAEPLKLDMPKVEMPKLDPGKVELPKVEMPKLDMPKLDMPKLDPIQIEPPKLEAPKVEPIKVEPPTLAVPTIAPPALTVDPLPLAEPKPVQPVLLPAPKPLEADPVSRAGEPAPPARPAKSAEPAPSSLQPLPEIPLRSSDPGFKVNPVGPAPAAPSSAAPEVSPTPGDAPMPLSVRQATLTAVVGAALMAAPVRSADDAGSKKAAEPPTVTKAELDSLKEELAAVKKTLEGKDDKGLTTDGLVKRVQRIEDRLETIQAALNEIRSAVKATPGTDSTSKKLVEPPAAGPNPGFVKIVNQYSQPVAMVINGGQSYRLDPGETKEVAVPAGAFRYYLLGSPEGEQSKTVEAGKTMPLYVR